MCHIINSNSNLAGSITLFLETMDSQNDIKDLKKNRFNELYQELFLVRFLKTHSQLIFNILCKCKNDLESKISFYEEVSDEKPKQLKEKNLPRRAR